MLYLIYILRTNKGTLYTGITNDLQRRLEAHKKNKGAKYLRGFSAYEVVYIETKQSRSEALIREAEIKRMAKPQKEALVASCGEHLS